MGREQWTVSRVDGVPKLGLGLSRRQPGGLEGGVLVTSHINHLVAYAPSIVLAGALRGNGLTLRDRAPHAMRVHTHTHTGTQWLAEKIQSVEKSPERAGWFEPVWRLNCMRGSFSRRWTERRTGFAFILF